MKNIQKIMYCLLLFIFIGCNESNDVVDFAAKFNLDLPMHAKNLLEKIYPGQTYYTKYVNNQWLVWYRATDYTKSLTKFVFDDLGSWSSLEAKDNTMPLCNASALLKEYDYVYDKYEKAKTTDTYESDSSTNHPNGFTKILSADIDDKLHTLNMSILDSKSQLFLVKIDLDAVAGTNASSVHVYSQTTHDISLLKAWFNNMMYFELSPDGSNYSIIPDSDNSNQFIVKISKTLVDDYKKVYPTQFAVYFKNGTGENKYNSNTFVKIYASNYCPAKAVNLIKLVDTGISSMIDDNNDLIKDLSLYNNQLHGIILKRCPVGLYDAFVGMGSIKYAETYNVKPNPFHLYYVHYFTQSNTKQCTNRLTTLSNMLNWSDKNMDIVHDLIKVILTYDYKQSHIFYSPELKKYYIICSFITTDLDVDKEGAIFSPVPAYKITQPYLNYFVNKKPCLIIDDNGDFLGYTMADHAIFTAPSDCLWRSPINASWHYAYSIRDLLNYLVMYKNDFLFPMFNLNRVRNHGWGMWSCYDMTAPYYIFKESKSEIKWLIYTEGPYNSMFTVGVLNSTDSIDNRELEPAYINSGEYMKYCNWIKKHNFKIFPVE